MKTLKLYRAWLLTLMTCLWLITTSLAQALFPVSGGRPGDLLGDPVFHRAWDFKESFRYEESLAEVRKVAAAYAGTEIEAAAMTEIASALARLGRRAAREGNAVLAADYLNQSDETWREIITRFPNTKYWLKARIQLRDEGPAGTYAILEEVGGPSHEAVRQGQLLRFNGDSIPIQYRQYVMDIFKHAGETEEEKLRFFLFFLKSFPRESSIGDLQDHYYDTNGLGPLNLELDTTPAVVEVFAPQNGATVSGGNASLTVSAHDGDIRSSQVDMSKSSVELDGQDILSSCELDYQVDPTGPVFVTVGIRYTPPVPLAPGPHIYRLAIHEAYEGGQVTEKIIHFNVGNTPPGPITQTLPVTKDALIDNFDPNGNEGNNSILALDKLLGRGSRSLVGFDLSGVDTNRLSKATLVLSIHKQEKIFGCGPGEQVSVQALTNSWVEGNGKTYKVLPLTSRKRGTGAGATWNRDTDSNIANILANGGYAWKGAQSATMPRTAPMVIARDDMQGTLQFDVTQDVLNGAPHGWLIRKQHENLASRISFYSKEGAVAAGNTELAPKLILEYGEPTASVHPAVAKVASFLGLPTPKVVSRSFRLQEVASGSELPSIKDALQKHPIVYVLGERLASLLLSHQPLIGLGVRSAYRSWIQDGIVLG